MRRWLLFLFTVFIFGAFPASAAAQDSVSVARLKSLKGVIAPFSQVAGKDSLFLVFFWSVNSEESLSALNTINADLEKWQAAVPFRLLAVSIDEGKTANRLRPTYNMNSWTFEVYLDLHGDLRRALHSNNLPQAMIVSRNKLLYEQSGYSAGSENYLLQKMIEIHRKGG